MHCHSSSRLGAMVPASARLPDSPPWHPLPYTSLAVARSGVRCHSSSRLGTMVPASARLPNSPPLHLLPHTSSAVMGLGPYYCHQLHLHLTVARHGISIGFVTRFPATAPTSHFRGGLTLRRLLLHTFPGSHSSVCCCIHSWQSCALARTHTSTAQFQRLHTQASAATYLPGGLTFCR